MQSFYYCFGQKKNFQMVSVYLLFQVIDFLNDLYICFDKTIENFDVYKVKYFDIWIYLTYILCLKIDNALKGKRDIEYYFYFNIAQNNEFDQHRYVFFNLINKQLYILLEFYFLRINFFRLRLLVTPIWQYLAFQRGMAINTWWKQPGCRVPFQRTRKNSKSNIYRITASVYGSEYILVCFL